MYVYASCILLRNRCHLAADLCKCSNRESLLQVDASCGLVDRSVQRDIVMRAVQGIEINTITNQLAITAVPELFAVYTAIKPVAYRL